MTLSPKDMNLKEARAFTKRWINNGLKAVVRSDGHKGPALLTLKYTGSTQVVDGLANAPSQSSQKPFSFLEW